MRVGGARVQGEGRHIGLTALPEVVRGGMEWVARKGGGQAPSILAEPVTNIDTRSGRH